MHRYNGFFNLRFDYKIDVIIIIEYSLSWLTISEKRKHNISQATRAEWVSWPSLRSGSTFSYIVIYFTWYLSSRAEWVSWRSLKSGRTFSYTVIYFIFDIFRPDQSELVDHLWEVAGHLRKHQPPSTLISTAISLTRCFSFSFSFLFHITKNWGMRSETIV